MYYPPVEGVRWWVRMPELHQLLLADVAVQPFLVLLHGRVVTVFLLWRDVREEPFDMIAAAALHRQERQQLVTDVREGITFVLGEFHPPGGDVGGWWSDFLEVFVSFW